MWNPDVAPVFSFERYARKHGVQRAREHWKKLSEDHQLAQLRAHQLELALAGQAEKDGPHVVNEELGGSIQWQMAPHTYWELHRSSLHERGAKGGELLTDDDYMGWFLKRNPECARKVVSGKVMSGYTAADQRLGVASAEGRMEKRVQMASACAVLSEAKQAGNEQRGGLAIAA